MALIIFDYPWQLLTLVTNFCSWFIVDTVVVRNNVFPASLIASLVISFAKCFLSYSKNEKKDNRLPFFVH